jgi:hypothetical protein
MKSLRQLPALAIAATLASAVLQLPSCTNNTAAAPSTGAATPSAGDNGNGSLAYTVDGTKTVVTPPASTIFINEVSHNTAKATVKIKVTIFPMGELFDFVVADKGTTNIEHYKPSFQEEKAGATYLSAKGRNYYGDHASVTISTIDAAHVAGTFSGTFADEDKSVTITDGSFDLPFKADSVH